MRGDNMKEYGTLMFLSLAGVILLVFTGESKAKTCMVRREEVEGVMEAVIENGDHFVSRRHKWMICNVTNRVGEANKVFWMCDASIDGTPTTLVNKFNWSNDVSSVTTCKKKVLEEIQRIKDEEIQLSSKIVEQDMINKNLEILGAKAQETKQECQDQIEKITDTDTKIQNIINEGARMNSLIEKEMTECENIKRNMEKEYDIELEKIDEEIKNVMKAIELKEQQLEELGINKCPSCDAEACWDDVKIKEELDKLYGKDGWTKSGGKCGVSHEDTEGNHSKYNENM
ncbi:hypothetical protein, conserved [Trypanosoma brucei brucei TREU927]|uniref:T. brucei spp.-specific protein n=1 Tax=Trypanosoma brucei brucei (strain 927/4 GUTat10.1) TaxID=185431 RepID=Q38EG1_TRYB2|nr:hypothetical protein, conserved [Trypanosoma brucei brucei TREU927]XP_827139.1 hypothetical protein, conserved [Trypanosoma brucei brucei TREU927]EAN76806.1 hypothetical protein, conserved [Trypanosoma brucei brucei TREU927]EAN76809.1 hypothetical protein, conserved [Trypanosoma brucei brucei TREU927]